MRAKVELTRVHAAELHAYLETKSKEAGESRSTTGSSPHQSEPIGAMLVRMSRRCPRGADAELVRIEATLVPLSSRAPYTLFTMRVFEIGLPLLACFFSLLCVFRYGLTEARSREIKELLALRHAAQHRGRGGRGSQSSREGRRHDRHKSTRTHVLLLGLRRAAQHRGRPIRISTTSSSVFARSMREPLSAQARRRARLHAAPGCRRVLRAST